MLQHVVDWQRMHNVIILILDNKWKKLKLVLCAVTQNYHSANFLSCKYVAYATPPAKLLGGVSSSVASFPVPSAL